MLQHPLAASHIGGKGQADAFEQLAHVKPLVTIRAQRLAAAGDDLLGLVADDLIHQIAYRAIVQVERLAVDICLASHGGDGDLMVILVLHQLEERLADGLARAYHAAIGGPAQVFCRRFALWRNRV